MKKLLLLLFLAGCATFQPGEPEDTQSQDAAQQITASAKELNVKPFVRELSSQAPGYVNRVQYLGKDSVIGMVRQYTVKENDSLIEIARRFDLGYN
jgi:hypothetical protein